MSIKEKVEQRTGIKLDDELYSVLHDRAKRKLDRVNERNGTSFGDSYLALLVEEELLFMAVSSSCAKTYRLT